MATDITIVLIRILTIFPLVLFLSMMMGKRAIGEMPIFDFLIILSLSSVVGADIANPDINHIPTVAAIVAITILQRIVSTLSIRFRAFGKWITFEPTVVIEDGKFLVKNIRSIRYSVDDIFQLLRTKGAFNVQDVELAIIEANGEISILKKPAKDTPTASQLSISTPMQADITFPLIIDGVVSKEMLDYVGLNEKTLRTQLEAKGIIQLEDVFLCTMTRGGNITLSYQTDGSRISPIQH